jgi:hypothetical protein
MEKISWIKDVILLIPIFALVWKAATLSGRIKQNEEDIKNLKVVAQSQYNTILQKLDEMKDTMSALRLDIEILKNGGKANAK